MKKFYICIKGTAKVYGSVEIEAENEGEAEEIYRCRGWENLPFTYELDAPNFVKKIKKKYTISIKK